MRDSNWESTVHNCGFPTGAATRRRKPTRSCECSHIGGPTFTPRSQKQPLRRSQVLADDGTVFAARSRLLLVQQRHVLVDCVAGDEPINVHLPPGLPDAPHTAQGLLLPSHGLVHGGRIHGVHEEDVAGHREVGTRGAMLQREHQREGRRLACLEGAQDLARLHATPGQPLHGHAVRLQGLGHLTLQALPLHEYQRPRPRILRPQPL
mmetsp:Transcript_60648/g.198445  ORF Transcript_60648/g.198445 Transcript_60648/m.198445 type:complete len:207 (+) Transcript_60648:80-700(+)